MLVLKRIKKLILIQFNSQTFMNFNKPIFMKSTFVYLERTTYNVYVAHAIEGNIKEFFIFFIW